MEQFTKELKAACQHVVDLYPEVDHVFVNLAGRWLFSDDSYDAPAFDERVNIDLLEVMVDSLQDLPAAFYIPEVLDS